MNRPSSHPKNASERHGAIAVVVMVAILITFSIGLGMVRTAITERREAIRWQNRKQADWLVEAGIERAVAQFGKSADYEGETWALSAEELGGRNAAQVVIELDPGEADDEFYQLTVVADYPVESEKRIRSRKVISVSRPTPADTDGT